MAEKKDIFEQDLQKKIASLTQDIEFLHFLPSTNIILDPNRDCGNLHKHIFMLAKAITDQLHDETEDPITQILLIPIATLLITGIANCGGLSDYAFYQWFIHLELKTLHELPILIFFTPENEELVDNQRHCAMGVGVEYDEEAYQNNKQIKIKSTEKMVVLDYWLKIQGKKKKVLKEIFDKSKTAEAHYVSPIKDCTTLEEFRQFQSTIQVQLKAICEEFSSRFHRLLSHHRFVDSTTIAGYSPNSKYYTNYGLGPQPLFPIDVKAAHEDLQKSLVARKDHPRYLEILPTFLRLWEYLIKNASSTSLVIFKSDPNPFIQTMYKKYHKDRCEGLFMLFRRCCGQRPSSKPSNVGVKEKESVKTNFS